MKHYILFLPLLATALLGCSHPSPQISDLPARERFVAMASDFADFRNWGSLALGERPAQSETHPGGRLTVFANALPPAGRREFPVGTMLVKETLSKNQTGEKANRVFAMVKRGGNFNSEGAVDWEWFELVEGPSGVAIGWRGVGPPTAETYGGDPMGGCNGCHQMALQNDYVLSLMLKLK